MADITLTDTNPAVAKAAGGGGPESAALLDANPAVVKAAGGGGRESAALIDSNPAIGKAAGGGGRQGILLYDPAPDWETEPPLVRARGGFNPLFRLMLDDD